MAVVERAGREQNERDQSGDRAAQVAADKCIAGGIRGIVNFAPARLAPTPGVFIRQVDLSTELMVVSFYLSQPAQ